MVDIPPTLISAISNETAVLFLGAGASYGATHPRGDRIPSGEKLRDLLSDRFLGGTLKNKPLSEVAELSSNESSLVDVQSFVKDIFKEFGPAPFHKLISSFRWHGIASTNFDQIVETVYDPVNLPAQQLVTFEKNGQPVETEMKKAVNGVQHLKLHGSIQSYHDTDIPLILATEQYVKYRKNRSRLFERLQDWGFEFPLIFCGYSISDPNIQNILFDLFDLGIKRPAYYVVAPGISPIEERYWASHRIFAIKCTFEEFLVSLDTAIPAEFRKIPAKLGGGTSTLRRHYRVSGAVESQTLLSFLDKDVTHVFPGMDVQGVDPRKFYQGYDVGWGALQQNLDVPRNVTDALVVEGILTDEAHRAARTDLLVLKGAAGNGKTIALKRAAWMAAHDYDKPCLFVRDGAALRIDAIQELFDYIQDRIFLFVDRAAFWVDELRPFIHEARRRGIQLTIVTAEREAEWNTKCEPLDGLVSKEFPVRYLSEREIRGLLERLDAHKSLGLLAEESFESRVKAFTERAQRQLLVALHETTLGKPFEDIVFDEYKSIPTVEARHLYLDVCSLYRFGIAVRAGLISRISGISFNDFKYRLFNPLEAIVISKFDNYLNDWVYTARHQRVAEILFERVLADPEERFDQLVRVMRGMNLDYSSDKAAFSQLVRGKSVIDAFASQELGRQFYEVAFQVGGNEAHAYQQRGIFEMDHPGGSLEKADAYLSRAAELDGHNRSIQHSRANLARRQSVEAASPDKRRQFRELARSRLGGLTGSRVQLPYGYHTAAQIAFDELRDLLAEGRSSENEQVIERAIVEVSKDFERHLNEGLQKFPLNEHLLVLESNYHLIVKDDKQAKNSLRKAFNSNPRLDWVAARLARTLADTSNFEEAKNVLKLCTQENPSSKKAHFDYARLLMEHGAPDERKTVKEHFRRAFTQGDENYDAQFWYARELFLDGQYRESLQMFERLSNVPLSPNSKNIVRGLVCDESGAIKRFSATVVSAEDSYCFVSIVDFPSRIYVKRSQSMETIWSQVARNRRVVITLGFNMRGPAAQSLDLPSN